jgi:hypothetical protein
MRQLEYNLFSPHLGTMCGASTLTGNATPSSPSRESVGLSVPEVRMTHEACSATGRNATAGRRHRSVGLALFTPRHFAFNTRFNG